MDYCHGLAGRRYMVNVCVCKYVCAYIFMQVYRWTSPWASVHGKRMCVYMASASYKGRTRTRMKAAGMAETESITQRTHTCIYAHATGAAGMSETESHRKNTYVFHITCTFVAGL